MDENMLTEKKKGLWDRIRLKRKRGELPARPGEKGYPKTLEIDEGIKQARKNVGSSKCWKGYKAQGTKKKGGKEVPNCIPEETSKIRYCPRCQKEESREQCKYGTHFWDMFSIPTSLTTNQLKYDIAQVHPTNEESSQSTTSSSTTTIKDEMDDLVVEDNQTTLQEHIEWAHKRRIEKQRTIQTKSFNTFVHEGIDKSKMKCNSPKAQSHGSGETGKSHLVKACSGGEEKIIRFGQKGVKGSPKKEGESEKYENRRKRFKARHAKNISKGKMSAAYWANKVKW
jgi:hypothetical protein